MTDSIRAKTLEFIRNNPERWNQSYFVSDSDVTGTKYKTVSCNTSFCLAGTAAYMTPPEDWDSYHIMETAMWSLDLDGEVADDLFYCFHTSEGDYNAKMGRYDWAVTHEAFVDLLERLFSQTDDTITRLHLDNVLPDWEKDNNVQ